MSTRRNHTTIDHRQVFDIVIVGAGLGGAVVGSALARAGKRVLLLEKGRDLHDVASPAAGKYWHPDASPEELLEGGRWPTPLTGSTSFGEITFHAPLGCGTGGSSTLYAAQMERFFAADFRPREHHSVTDSTLPEAWPIDYEAMRPWYEAAEQQFSVCGTADPLRNEPINLPEPPDLGPRDADLFEMFQQQGLHPYRPHVACRYLPDCSDCGGRFCARACKQDSGWACLLPALRGGGATLMPDCEVQALEATRSRVVRLHAIRDGEPLTIEGKTFVLAAGAYMSPVLLLRSRSRDWPQGLANRSGLVGRNLMLHTGDMLAVRPRGRPEVSGPQKAIALNDFYFDGEGSKLGTFQSMGVPVNSGLVLSYLRNQAQRNPRWWRPLAAPLLPLVALAGAKLHARSGVFATIVEDLPYHDNCIVPDASTPSGTRFHYRYRAELAARNRQMRKLLIDRLGRTRVAILSGENNLNFGHPSGTCRFGDDPRTSVLDATNRAHDLDNLFVVDASFMPSSGGTNPSLTIAANALRVAAAMLDRGV